MATYNPDWVKTFYDQYGEKEWKRWDASPVEQIKFQVHLYYLSRYLGKDDRVLEIGAGAGRFTQALCSIAKKIVVADISPVQLQLNQENVRRLGLAGSIERWVECDLCDLRPHFRDGEFDAVVCYGGPLSYVFEKRHQAVAELLRVTRPGGRLFLGVMSLWGTVHHYLAGVLQVSPALNRKIIASGDLASDLGISTHLCHMYRAAEFKDLIERAGGIVEVLSASDCLSGTWAAQLETIRENVEVWRHLMEIEMEACREPGCVDMGTHLIAACRKPA